MFKKNIRIKECLFLLLSLVFLTATAFGQGVGASLVGTVSDASGGVVSGANVVARNVDTGVETRMTTNDRGAFTFPSLQVGTYELTAEAPGFSRATRSDVRLNVGAQSRLDLTLMVAGSVTEVEVTGAAESIVLEAGASTGTVMQEETMAAVPLLSNNVMDLINIMGGVSQLTTNMSAYNPGSATFAGVAAANINVSRDGITVNEVRLPTGINASSNINAEMIGEFRMVLSPVDAEMGRGAGQVQMTTRSGTNAFHASGVWNAQNTVFDAIDFSQKLGNVQPSWRNLNNYMLTASGPIVRNRSFFFVTWEQQFSRIKYAYTAKAMSNCARYGIYRYIGGAVPSAAAENNLYDDGTDYRPSVDQNGSILDRQSGASFMDQSGNVKSFDAAHPSSFYGSQTLRPFDGELMFESVFGPLTQAARDIINRDVRDVSMPCEEFAKSGLWNPNAEQFGTNGFWDERPFGEGINGRDGRAYRHYYDPTGYVDRFTYGVPWSGGTVVMPPVNYWSGHGDGLNVASHRWTRSSIGGREGLIYGTGADPDRKSITFKIDHNINNNNRLSGTYTHENYIIDEAEAQWPAEYGGFGGAITRRPRTFLGSLTSTLRPTLLNEFRFGYMRSNTGTIFSMRQNPEQGYEILDLLMPVEKTHDNVAIIGVGEGMMDFHTDEVTYNWGSHPVGSRGAIQSSQISIDNRWTFADTVTWMKGSHSFKAGVEYRWQNSLQEVEGGLSLGRAYNGLGAVTPYPAVFGGLVSGVNDRRTGMLYQHPTSIAGETWRNVPVSGQSTDRHSSQAGPDYNGAISQGNTPAGLFVQPYQMMSYFAGSVARVSQYFYMVPDSDTSKYPYGARWNDAANPDERTFKTDVRNQELSFFFKDDWRINNDLTLNLGVRWEYYGVPHAAGGKTLSLKGGSNSIFGASQPIDDVTQFLYSRNLRAGYENIPFGALGDNGAVLLTPITAYEYIGPGSLNPDRMAWNRDMNNFAPHIGFAYQLPWFGRGMTTLRGGWSISYAQIGNLGTYDEWIARNAAALPVSSQQFYGEGTDNAISGSTIHYMDLTDLSRTDPQGPLPMRVRGGLEPMRPINVGYFGQGASAIDENIRNPLTHSLNVSLTRNIRSSLTLDVRYIGTFGRNMINGIDINQNDYINSGLARELDFIRRNASYQSDLINSLLPPGGLASPFVIPATLSGSDQLRHRSGQASNLAQMNYNAIVTTLATGNGNYGTVTGENGRIFRHGCLPTQRMDPGGDMADHVGNPCLYHTPLNYFRLNPQSGSATIQTNVSKSSYHSMQTQVTMRPMHGLNFQATWTWSRALGNGGAWWNLYGDREWNLTTQHRSHTLNIFGSYELPFGPRGLLLRDSTGFIKKTVEGWQLSWVIASRAGSPMSITGQTTQWGTNFPILVRPDLWDDKAGQIETRWNDDGTYAGGRYWGDKYTRVMDPGVCNPENMDPNLYNLYCWDSNANAGLGAIRNTGNIRAIALADPKRPDTDPQTGAPYATLYAEDTIGADGVLYKKGTPVIVFRNATGTFGSETYNPLSRGTYRNNRITAPGQFTFDAAISKSIEFMEGKRIELRVDVGNILNHPTATGNYPADVRYMSGGRSTTPDPPANLNINTTGAAAVGNMPSKTQHRIFQAKVRIAF